MIVHPPVPAEAIVAAAERPLEAGECHGAAYVVVESWWLIGFEMRFVSRWLVREEMQRVLLVCVYVGERVRDRDRARREGIQRDATYRTIPNSIIVGSTIVG